MAPDVPIGSEPEQVRQFTAEKTRLNADPGVVQGHSIGAQEAAKHGEHQGRGPAPRRFAGEDDAGVAAQSSAQLAQLFVREMVED